MRRVWKEIDRQNRQDNINAMQALRNQEIQFVKPADPEQIEWKKIASIVPRRMIESGVLSRDIVIKLEKYLQDYRMKEPGPNEHS